MRPLTKKVKFRLDIVKFLMVIVATAGLICYCGSRTAYNWQWYRVPTYIVSFESGKPVPGLLLKGLWITVQITSLSLIVTIILGGIAALFRLSDSWSARIIARIYVELIRNTPLLVQLFFIYFVLSPVLNISRFFSAVLALSLFEGAYASEIFRAGIVSIHKSQWEAAFSLGFSRVHTYRWVILPQAVRRILPPLTSQVISLLKDSALVSTIAIYDLAMQGQAIVAETYLTFEIWFVVAFIYLVIALILSFCVHYMEQRFKVET